MKKNLFLSGSPFAFLFIFWVNSLLWSLLILIFDGKMLYQDEFDMSTDGIKHMNILDFLMSDEL